MSVKLRLARYGNKKRPFYRIVAADIECPRDGKFLDILGTYDPNQEPAKVELNADKVKGWLAKGAQASDTVKSLIKKHTAA